MNCGNVGFSVWIMHPDRKVANRDLRVMADDGKGGHMDIQVCSNL